MIFYVDGGLRLGRKDGNGGKGGDNEYEGDEGVQATFCPFRLSPSQQLNQLLSFLIGFKRFPSLWRAQW